MYNTCVAFVVFPNCYALACNSALIRVLEFVLIDSVIIFCENWKTDIYKTFAFLKNIELSKNFQYQGYQ